MPKNRTSIKDVAKAAGVSYAAVSAVLSGKAGKHIRVSKTTEERIWEAARELNYTPNLSARSLVSGKTNIISVFTYEPIFPFKSDNEFYPFLLGIEQEAEHRGFDLLMITNRHRQQKTDREGVASGVERLRMADGGILLGVERDTSAVKSLISEGFPLVIIGRRDLDGYSTHYVSFDYQSIINEMMDYVYEMGHRNIVYFRRPDHYEMSEDRENALKQAAGFKNGINLTIPFNDEKSMSPVLIESLIHRGNTLFISETIDYAEMLISCIDELGYTLGQEVSGALLSDLWRPVKHPWVCWSNVRPLLGMKAVQLLLDLIDGGNIDSPALIKPTLIKGQTVAKIC